MKIYVVNELCELDNNYNNCHGAYTNIKEAKTYAAGLYKSALNNLGGEDICTIDISEDECDYQICNDDYSIEIHIDEVEVEIDFGNMINRDDYIASILWTEDDISTALENKGYKPSEENIEVIFNAPRFEKTLHENSIATGWETIEYVISDNSDNLELLEGEN